LRDIDREIGLEIWFLKYKYEMTFLAFIYFLISVGGCNQK